MGSWFSQNRDAIVAGVIGSIIAILLQVVAQSSAIAIAYFVTFRLRLRRLLAFCTESPVSVVSGSMERELQRSAAILMGPDATAANQIGRIIEEIYPNLRTRHIYSSADQGLYLEENVVAVGGPVYNLCSRQVMANLKPLVFFDAQDRLHAFGHIYDKSEPEAVDYGLVIRMPNPFAPRNTAWVIAGCGSHGVLAASHLVSRRGEYPELLAAFRRHFGFLNWLLNRHFAAVLQCKIMGNEVANIEVKAVRRVGMPPPSRARRLASLYGRRFSMGIQRMIRRNRSGHGSIVEKQ